MAKRKTTKTPQDLATPFSVMLFNEDKKELDQVARKAGVTLSVLVRLSVRNALNKSIFKTMTAS